MSAKFRIFCNKLARASLLYTNQRAPRTFSNIQNFKSNIHRSLFSTTSRSYQNNSVICNETAKVDYVNNLVKVTIKLPARGELCEFNFKLLNDTVGTLIENLMIEDRSIDKAQVFTNDGVRISQNTPISAIVLEPFVIKINDTNYMLEPPSLFAKDPVELEVQAENDLENVKQLVSKLYLHLNVEHFEMKREHEILKELEVLKTELQPMEKTREDLTIVAKKHTNRMVWLGLGLMGIQAGILARLTWFDYSWDIVEPISYFVSYSAVVGTYAYFVLTRKEYDYASATDRIFLRNFHKNAAKQNLDVSKYNDLKNTIYKLENDLRRIKTSQLKNYEDK